ncbi:hypothetical protein SLEP1_g28448 [Rubroshorea leprosula]|uniref:GRF-type domain-containing protein n=1 Tax=Rubroshorea leprosula TaxID=152421 RepID=A0AAV5K073_9ROSI|nr:hypothetical protein SLEP1_g28448 [Rubroshorea leprosula]
MFVSSSHSRFVSVRSKVFLDCGNAEYVYEGHQRHCKCGLKSLRYTSWTETNPERRFYGCPNFGKKDSNGDLLKTYNFIEWHDEPMSSRAIDVILELKGEREALKTELEQRKEPRGRDKLTVDSSEASTRENEELMILKEDYGMRCSRDKENAESRYVRDEVQELKELKEGFYQ